MFRGFTQFVCDDCGHKFTGPDMEWMCTVYPAPVKCPKCDGWHTYPSGFHVCLPLDGFISTAGGVAVACGAGLWAIDRNKKPVVQRDVAFYKVTSHYYKSLSDIFKHVTNSWTDSLVELKSKLKAEIMQQNISEEEKNSAIQSVLTTSVVDLSMADLSSKLGKIERDHDEEGYKRFVSIFEKKCIEAINNAFDEQKAVYERLQF